MSENGSGLTSSCSFFELGDPARRDHVGARGRDLAELHERRPEVHGDQADALGERDLAGLFLAALGLGLGDGGVDDALLLGLGRRGPGLLAAEPEALRQLAEAVADEDDVDLAEAIEVADGADEGDHARRI
ncbi:MAG: hypothetical protein QM820_53670 [Minicystis sp.]